MKIADSFLVPTPSEIETSHDLKEALAASTLKFFAPGKVQVATTVHALLEMVSELQSRCDNHEIAVVMATEKLAADAGYCAEVVLRRIQ